MNDSAKLSEAAVYELVNGLPQASLDHVYFVLEARIKTEDWPQIEVRYEPGIKVDEDAHIEKLCPHCGSIDPGFVEVDVCQRWNEAELGAVDINGDGKVHVYTSGQSDFETLAYQCRACEGYVNLPGDNDVTWS